MKFRNWKTERMCYANSALGILLQTPFFRSWLPKEENLVEDESPLAKEILQIYQNADANKVSNASNIFPYIPMFDVTLSI